MNKFVPLPKDAQSVSNLIFSLKEGYGIWFSYDGITGHSGGHDYVSKISNGREYEYRCEGDHCSNSELEGDDDINSLANEIVSSGDINYYIIQPIQGYQSPRRDPEEDDQAIGDYEKYGPDRPEPQYENKHYGTMKKQLLEYLVRRCVREVISQTNQHTITEGKNKKLRIREEEDPTKGAPAPPESGQGTADQPEIPKEKDTTPEPASQPQTPSTNLKGAVLVDPRDKAKLIKVPVQSNNDAKLERILYNQAAKYAGPKVKVSLSAIRMAKNIATNPNTTTYFYIGKYDPSSDEVFLMADNSLQVAKDSSISSGETSGNSQVAPTTFDPLSADSDEFSQRLASQGKVNPEMPEQEPDANDQIDERLKKMIHKVINEVLDGNK